MATDTVASPNELAVTNEEAAFVVPDDANDQAMSVIRTNVLISMGIGFVPLPLIDLVALTGQQLIMSNSLGKIYGVEFRQDLARKTVLTLIGASAPNSSLKYALVSMLKLVPVVGHMVAGLALPILSGATTYAVGKVLNMHFASGGTFLSFDPTRYKKQFQKELEAGLNVSKDLKKEADSADKGTVAP